MLSVGQGSREVAEQGKGSFGLFGRRGLQRSVFQRGFSSSVDLPAKLSCRVRNFQFRLSSVRCSDEGTVDEALGRTNLVPFYTLGNIDRKVGLNEGQQ